MVSDTHLNSQFYFSDSDLPNPFGQLGVDLSDSDLRETAYEIFIGACRSSGGSRPLTYVSSSTERLPSLAPTTSAAASKVKKALGLKRSENSVVGQMNSVSSGAIKGRRAVTIGELVRVQMRISEQTDSRIRRALLRITAGQIGKRIESTVIPLELLQLLKSSDFPTPREYEAWQKRILKVLEAGLLLNPHMPRAKTDVASQQLRHIVREALESQRPIETGKQSEAMQALRNNIMSLACRSFDGSISEICHWADGVPLNLRLYQIFLEACFDLDEATSIIEEIDEVLELVKKTWVILGINQTFHNLCFSWVLFHRYVATGQVENDLLFAAENLLLEVEKDAKAINDPAYSKILSSTLSLISGWTEKKLIVYHDTFYRGNVDVMQSVLSLSVLTAKMVEDISHEYPRKNKEDDIALGIVESFIRSSLRNAFSQEREKVQVTKRSTRHQQNPLPVLSILAQDISDLAYNEKEIFSPILKTWHPLATGVAVATLHSCFGNELRKFISGISELSPDGIQVLFAADKLEKDLVQMAVEDSVESEDGGKSIIQEMTPYEAEGVIENLAKSWIRTRIDRLKEWVDRNLQQEVWNPIANKQRFAPSAVEVLRIVDETLEAFFLLPIPRHTVLLPDLMSGLDKCLEHYILKTKSGTGSRSDFIPAIPALTRCAAGSKLHRVLNKKDKLVQRRKPPVGVISGEFSGIPQLCVRINTLHHIGKDLEVLESRTIAHLNNNEATYLGKKLELSESACLEGVQQLCVATAYKVVFQDLSPVFWDFLYVGDVSSYRIESFLEELDQYLEIISSTVDDRVRTRLVTQVMKASFECFLLVLLAGGPGRAYTLEDSAIIEEDFKFLRDLFWSNGDGLPAELVDKFAITVQRILPLFRTSTESLVEQLRSRVVDEYGSSASARLLPLPPTSGKWNPAEANTILRVLCYRNDKLASNFLKRTYGLPKKL